MKALTGLMNIESRGSPDNVEGSIKILTAMIRYVHGTQCADNRQRECIVLAIIP